MSGTVFDRGISQLCFCLFGLLVFAQWSSAMMPEICFNNATVNKGSGICCPIPKDHKLPCGGAGMGQCDRLYIQSDSSPKFKVFEIDDRFNWPSKFFHHMCTCEGNYWGLACNECRFGWEGEKCMTKSKIVRRNVMNFTTEERQKFVNIVARMTELPTEYLMPIEIDRLHSDPMKDMQWEKTNLHYYIAAIHRYASRATLFSDKDTCSLYGFLDNNHDVIGFTTWHRYLLLIWERELRKVAKDMYGWNDFGMPYWDWIDATKCDPCINELVGAPGPYKDGIRLLDPASPFSKWIEYCSIPKMAMDRCYACHTAKKFNPLNRNYTHTEFPTTDDLDFVMSRRTYYLEDKNEGHRKCRSLHYALEGFCGRPNDNTTMLFMHNKVHNMVHGSLCCSATASNDPLFILHHSQMDRLFQLWFRRHKPTASQYPNHGTEIGNCRECNLIGFLPLARHEDMFVDMDEFNVVYDNYNFGKNGFTGENYWKNGTKYPEEYWTKLYEEKIKKREEELAKDN